MKFHYKIAGKNYVQEELSFDQDKEFWDFYIKVSKKAPEKDITLTEILNLLLDKSLLAELLNIILSPTPGSPWKVFFGASAAIGPVSVADAGKMKNSQIRKILNDFFLLNKAFLSELAKSGNVLGLIVQMATAASQTPSSSTTASQNITQSGTSSNTTPPEPTPQTTN